MLCFTTGVIEPPNKPPNLRARTFRFLNIHYHPIRSLLTASMNVRSGTLIDMGLKRHEFTATVQPPFRKGKYEFEAG
jgi:hypothetical protein